ncbi:cation transporter [Arthrobacter sp. JSM 101049]|uniref:cation transporter n=1 Tax=Arthrobacter sp. JSM 101049 TaxID=929097 RepID=UPI003568B56C
MVSFLLKAEHPTIGTVELFGTTIWLGWLMMAVMAIIAVPPVVFGRLKMKCAEPLHNKLLFADADMSKADWQTNVASIVGVAGVGIAWWWMDAVAALVIAAGILPDGIKNTSAAVLDLMDHSATTFDLKSPHPLIRDIDDVLKGLDWVAEAHSRVRDMGHVFHVESFLVPATGGVDIHQLREAHDACAQIDWKIQDIVIVPVDEVSSDLDQTSSRDKRA